MTTLEDDQCFTLAPLNQELTTSPTRVDFIGNLPLEISQIILDSLDARSLLNAAQVSHSWLFACKSRQAYRIRVYDYLVYLNEAWKEYCEQRQRYRMERMKEKGLQICCICLLGTFVLLCAVITVSLVSRHFAGNQLVMNPYSKIAANTRFFGWLLFVLKIGCGLKLYRLWLMVEWSCGEAV